MLSYVEIKWAVASYIRVLLFELGPHQSMLTSELSRAFWVTFVPPWGRVKMLRFM